jgi:uncharacterized protein with GYD domain
MPIFVTLGNFTEKGKAMIKDVANLEAYQAGIHKLMASYGGKLISVYLTMGRFDYIMITEFSSEEIMLKMLAIVGANGNSVTETMIAVSMEQAIQIMKS